MNPTQRVVVDLIDERRRQIAKFGDQSHRSPAEWAVILGEEYGEAMREACDLHFLGQRGYTPQIEADVRDRLRIELVQTAAVCVAWIEALDGGDNIVRLADVRRAA